MLVGFFGFAVGVMKEQLFHVRRPARSHTLHEARHIVGIFNNASRRILNFTRRLVLTPLRTPLAGVRQILFAPSFFERLVDDYSVPQPRAAPLLLAEIFALPGNRSGIATRDVLLRGEESVAGQALMLPPVSFPAIGAAIQLVALRVIAPGFHLGAHPPAPGTLERGVIDLTAHED